MSEVATAKRPTNRAKAKSELLLTLGNYRLYSMPGRNHEIQLFTPGKRNPERQSAGTTDLAEATRKMEKLYYGNSLCRACGQPLPTNDGENSDLILDIIGTYLNIHGEERTSSEAIGHRLELVKRYIVETFGDTPVRVGNVNDVWIADFRKWALKPENGYWVGSADNRRQKPRKRSTVENSVVQLGAAIRKCGKTPLFKAKQLATVTDSPDFRADIPLLAAMLRYCLYPDGKSEEDIERKRQRRVNMLYFIRMSIATWGRPDAVMDANLARHKKQWVSDARVFRLNPADREQSPNKWRATVPVPELVGQWLDSLPEGPILPATVSKATFGRMMKELKPGLLEGEGGMKLIRRSMANLAEDFLGVDFEKQIGRMLGHDSGFSVTRVYTLSDPSRLGHCLRFTESVVDELEALVPGAFSPVHHKCTTKKSNIVEMRA